ncbi:MAG: phosphonate metabolism protein/1,5-bisphosphokinase (PRPP-forming) PhnN [Piscirickettsiaceae bacterium CG_4_9_14_3_um_filter_43_564]|jgi:ribose 1,5-bisphosphokinase|uniref:Ribose 1,5-bisphosphate phosphokinase PhnN n=2 Tax=Hydrogenovibrio crunogenus TaxID=39765 RepID=A0A4P7P1Z5_9GAMM|nr:phosphonate metabolism protein/1,5-bisphosphokinase (PRPP-forming) PhnN [Hydrogenovibrio crunogenus]NCN44240.1 phosphonate metabolism protein/1,5-bisphosphokinase (PRPP-forming) PhnN [Thiomicrospira sp.]PJA66160.1 MAG: phosphonate metabolism protein/1,5-bisphosphokinase (PRPP-forming) PhnN [Piscirickettsiaceae bacterium CG_4_9_14_3_um_filter_43_564]NCN67360.1 phosphonate metabolism protein/1,5-bisphosphokinase (PRPP-forming) PhnN [Thiomicrospira sp.]NCO13600.1 phosphonate metabolism protein/
MIMPNQAHLKPAPGTLFYVMGASGCGKDSLLHYARQQLASEAVVFTHRYITRPVELTGENHIQLSTAEFTNRLKHHCFKFHWHSHDLDYGIGIEVDHWLNQGLNVVMNGSRGYLETAIQKQPDLVPVLIEVDVNVLRERLINRGRETLAQIEKRVQRAETFVNLRAPNLQRIENNTELSVSGERLVNLLKTKDLKSP